LASFAPSWTVCWISPNFCLAVSTCEATFAFTSASFDFAFRLDGLQKLLCIGYDVLACRAEGVGVAGLLLRMAGLLWLWLAVTLLRQANVVLDHLHAVDGPRDLRGTLGFFRTLGEPGELDSPLVRVHLDVQGAHGAILDELRLHLGGDGGVVERGPADFWPRFVQPPVASTVPRSIAASRPDLVLMGNLLTSGWKKRGQSQARGLYFPTPPA
jgi:hypothetical protein